MKRTKTVILVMAAVIVFANSQAMAVLFEDGLSHDITDATYKYQNVVIWDSFLGGTTKINSLSGGYIGSADVYENSLINIDGGRMHYSAQYYTTATGTVKTHDSSSAYISDGRIDKSVYAYDNSQIVMSGGRINNYLLAYNNARIYVSGGTVTNHIAAYDNSVLTFIGKNFVFGGVEVDYGTFDTMGNASVHAPLSGLTLAGDPISYDLYFEQGTQVVLIPEPATLCLFALGGFLIRRKNDNSVR